MTELLLALFLIMATLGGTITLVKAEWQTTRCAYQVFEKAHARLTGALEAEGSGWITVEETPIEVVASGNCGRATERVALPRLQELR
ncbi:MAG: hypothetical protein NDJ89_10870 [Oligoflexia bacterium]|nr:hypothetical protein [Oligoflexia bacterium]